MADPIEAERRDLLARHAPLEIDGNRAVRQRVGQVADDGDGDGREGGERAGFVVVAHGAHHLAALAMPGIENAAQLVGLAQKGVGLVDQQRRAIALHDPE